jgi:hypothetical protein
VTNGQRDAIRLLAGNLRADFWHFAFFLETAAAAFAAAGFFPRSEKAVGEGGDGESDDAGGEITLQIQNFKI